MASESFTSSIKTELSLLRVKRRSDALALLSAFTLGIGNLKYVPDKRCWGLHYVLKSRDAIELAVKLINQYCKLECRLAEVSHQRLKARYCELIVFGEGLDAFMLETGFTTLDKEGERQFSPCVPSDVIRTENQKKMFMRGLFLACGMVSHPRKSYHAEFVLTNPSIAEQVVMILASSGIEPKYTSRKNNFVVYIKDGDKLEDLLAFIGASAAMMEVSNERIVKQANNEANRSVNCINANIERATASSLRQAEDIRLVIETIGYDNLPDDLRVVAEERMNNFELSLSELADELGIGRSAVNYRLKKLSRLADEIRSGSIPKLRKQ